MRITQPNNSPELSPPYNIVKVQGCSDSVVGFDILQQVGEKGKRRYCNKTLVHECVSSNISDPAPLQRAEFYATDDPCYATFNIFKSSEEISDGSDIFPPEITLQLDDYDLAIGILVNFNKETTCCLPLRMAYRLYGFLEDESRILLSTGNLYVTPCACVGDPLMPVVADAEGMHWTGINW